MFSLIIVTVDCDNPPNISHGFVSRSVDTVLVICDNGYESDTPSIACSDFEALQTASCTPVGKVLC